MSKFKHKKAHEAMVRARTVLIVSQPFWGALALNLELVEIEDASRVNTMAVDGIHLFYRPDWVVNKITETEAVGVVAHEVSHLAYLHHTRRGSRHPKIWNMAGDYVINNDLKKAGFQLPSCGLFNPKYEGWSTEEVYEDLLKNVKEAAAASGGGDGEGSCVEGPSGMGGVMDAPGDKNAQAENQQTWEANVRMAAAVAKGQMAGKLPGFLEGLMKALNKPKVSWRDQTREFIDNSMTKDYSWARPNRRSVSTGCLLPGMISDSLNHLVVVIDNSGSTVGELQQQFVNEAQGALDDRVADKVTLIYADDGVRLVDEYVPGDLIESKVLYGGGTNFRPTFDWIRDNAHDASCVIYLTDLFTSDFGDEPTCPVLWGTWGSEHNFPHLAAKVPFGHAIFVHAE